MIRRRVYLALAAFVASLGVSMSAWALTTTSYFTIDRLELTGNGYKIYPVGSTISVGSCSTDYYELDNGTSSDVIAEYNKTVLSAFLAGKKVKLWVSTGSNPCGPTGRPVYTRVGLDKDE
jgi:hypothetical protein